MIHSLTWKDNLLFLFTMSFVVYTYILRHWVVFVPFLLISLWYVMVLLNIRFFKKWWWRLYFKHHLVHIIKKMCEEHSIMFLVLVRAELAEEEEFLSRSLDDYLTWVTTPNAPYVDNRSDEDKALESQAAEVYNHMEENDPFWNDRLREAVTTVISSDDEIQKAKESDELFNTVVNKRKEENLK